MPAQPVGEAWQMGSVHPTHLKRSAGVVGALWLMMLSCPGGSLKSSGATRLPVSVVLLVVDWGWPVC